MMINGLGRKIKEERLSRKLSGEDLGKILGVTRTAISNWENGKRIPDITTIMSLADYFDVSIDYLMDRSMLKNSNVIRYSFKTNDTFITYDVNVRNLITHLEDAGFDIPKLFKKLNNTSSN
ncbi:helix-turn-helix domain-containing protein [Clostridium sp. DL1XJH146]